MHVVCCVTSILCENSCLLQYKIAETRVSAAVFAQHCRRTNCSHLRIHIDTVLQFIFNSSVIQKHLSSFWIHPCLLIFIIKVLTYVLFRHIVGRKIYGDDILLKYRFCRFRPTNHHVETTTLYKRIPKPFHYCVEVSIF